MTDARTPKGLLTALVTPFRGDEIDEGPYADFVDWQISNGVDGLVPCSLTGEGPTLTPAEHARLFRKTVEIAAGRASVVASVGANCTASAVHLAAAAKTAGADAVLVSTPYYNRPSQEGLYRHFEEVARAVDLPIILHVIASHTHVDLCNATLERLSAIPSIVAVCDEGAQAVRPFGRGDRSALTGVHGHDRSASTMALTGATAWISRSANVAPDLCSALLAACRDQDLASVVRLQQQLEPLSIALERESVPAAVKYAVSRRHAGFEAKTRLPIVPVTQTTASLLDTAIDALAGVAERPPVGRARES